MIYFVNKCCCFSKNSRWWKIWNCLPWVKDTSLRENKNCCCQLFFTFLNCTEKKMLSRCISIVRDCFCLHSFFQSSYLKSKESLLSQRLWTFSYFTLAVSWCVCMAQHWSVSDWVYLNIAVVQKEFSARLGQLLLKMLNGILRIFLWTRDGLLL